MNCSCFAMERRETFRVKKIQQTNRQTKTKQNENIQTSERVKQYTNPINFSKKFSFGKIQYIIQ